MKKISLFLLPLFLFANESYVIEADGEFGRELKELIEKHSKENNTSVRVYQKQEKSRLLNIGVDKQSSHDSKLGEDLYKNKCQRCHGENGKSSFMGAARLSEMSAEDIEQAFSGYNSDLSYGGRNKHLMQPVAKSTSYKELGAIITYLKGGTTFIVEDNPQNTDIETKPKIQGSYLE